MTFSEVVAGSLFRDSQDAFAKRLCDGSTVDHIAFVLEAIETVERSVSTYEEKDFVSLFHRALAADVSIETQAVIEMASESPRAFEALKKAALQRYANEQMLPAEIENYLAKITVGAFEAPKKNRGPDRSVALRDSVIVWCIQMLRDLACLKVSRNAERSSPHPVTAIDVVSEALKLQFNSVERIWKDSGQKDKVRLSE